jgi:GABA(A) receptor-associated protein
MEKLADYFNPNNRIEKIQYNIWGQHFSLEKRQEECKKLLIKYPDRIPILICKDPSDKSKISDIDKKKYLVPRDLTLGQFIHVIRKRLTIKSEIAVYIYFKFKENHPISDMMSDIYRKEKGEDGFLVGSYFGENTFGY